MSNYLDKLKLSGTTYDLFDSTALHELDSTVTSDGANAVKGSGIYNAITASTAALAEAVGQEISGKADTTAVTQAISEATSGKVDTNTYTAYTAATDAILSGKADASDLTSLFGAVAYDSETQHINFYHSSTTGTVLTYVDATPFVKDGFLESVDIEDVELSGETVTCLVFKWNTDAGIQETDIPLTDVFNPSNYMTSAQTVSAITEAVSGKQDTLSAGTGIDITSNIISVTGIPNVDQTVISGSTNPVAGGAVYTELQGKQATLVNQTNIKSINNESLLGSGNITTLQASVSGTTLIIS